MLILIPPDLSPPRVDNIIKYVNRQRNYAIRMCVIQHLINSMRMLLNRNKKMQIKF